MLIKKVKSRVIFLISILFLILIIVFTFLKLLEESVVYFLSPTEIHNNTEVSLNKKIRIGGMIKKDSLKIEKNLINFTITDYKNEIFVSYSGAVPNLIAENKGVVAEGKLKDRKYFLADRILAKHDENYMPPEISDALKKAKE